jgi:hypothetical protein
MPYDSAPPARPHSFEIPSHERGYPVVAGGDISLSDRLALAVGYAAFGLAMGAGGALALTALSEEAVAVAAAAPAVVALVLAVLAMRYLGGLPAVLIALAVVAVFAGTGRVMFAEDASRLLDGALLGAALLLATMIAFCRHFAPAFLVALLGVALAAPVGAAAMLSMFG